MAEPEDGVTLLMAAAFGLEGTDRRHIERACATVRVMIKRHHRRIGKPLDINHELYACRDPLRLLEALGKLPPEVQRPLSFSNV